VTWQHQFDHPVIHAANGPYPGGASTAEASAGSESVYTSRDRAERGFESFEAPVLQKNSFQIRNLD
jgi:hypothetical protein